MTYDYFFDDLQDAITQIWTLQERVSISCEQFTQIAEIENPDDMFFVHKNKVVGDVPVLNFTQLAPHLSLTYKAKGRGETTVDVEIRRKLFDLILSFKSGKITFDDLLNELRK
jgi:hypothetical protein